MIRSHMSEESGCYVGLDVNIFAIGLYILVGTNQR